MHKPHTAQKIVEAKAKPSNLLKQCLDLWVGLETVAQESERRAAEGEDASLSVVQVSGVGSRETRSGPSAVSQVAMDDQGKKIAEKLSAHKIELA
eukprot:scaffold618_cov42-Prasinocladus_malaysianus.AAC.1